MESGSTHIANWVIWVLKQRGWSIGPNKKTSSQKSQLSPIERSNPQIVNWAQQVKLMKKAQVFKSI
ncbi:hypothetical protein KSS87_020854, partial [Heliosperma pusillum]